MAPPPADALQSRLLELVRQRGHSRRDAPFRLASGELSHDYVDMRRAVSRGEDLRLAAEAVQAALAPLGAFAAIGGMTMGADPIAHAVALLFETNWYSVRKAEKSHGTGQRIEGAELSPTTPVIVFEDTVSTGASLLEALEVVQATGAPVLACCTVLDRGDLATPQFAQRAVPYVSLLTYRDLGIKPIRGVAAATGQTR